jgi:hypothetical protein
MDSDLTAIQTHVGQQVVVKCLEPAQSGAFAPVAPPPPDQRKAVCAVEHSGSPEEGYGGFFHLGLHE